MSLALLFKDELRGFYKSKVMIVLWIGLPLIPIFMRLIQPETEGIPITALVGLLMASVSGTLSSVMLSTTLVNEKSNHVYDLFLIRPVKRYHLLLAKFLAVYLCLFIAIIISLSIGLGIDLLTLEIPFATLIKGVWESLAISMAAMAIACSAGLLLGVLVNSVMVAAILSVYLGNQMSMIAVLPAMLIEGINPVLFSAIVGVSTTAIILTVMFIIFERKQF